MTLDPAAARRHLETTADLVVVHDVMAEALSQLRGLHSRAGASHPRGSAEYAWSLAQMVAVDQFRDAVDVTDRGAMLAALDRATAELRRLNAQTTAA